MRRTGRHTEDEKSISKSLQKRERSKPFRVERKAARESSVVQSGLRTPEYISFHKVLKEFSDFELSSFIYLLFFSPESLLRGCTCSKGLWKGNNRPGEGNATSTGNAQTCYWNSGFLTAPGIPPAVCQGDDYRISAWALPAAECSNFFTISGLFFFITSWWHLSRDF